MTHERRVQPNWDRFVNDRDPRGRYVGEWRYTGRYPDSSGRRTYACLACGVTVEGESPTEIEALTAGHECDPERVKRNSWLRSKGVPFPREVEP